MTNIVKRIQGWTVSPEAGVLQIFGVMMLLIMAAVAIPLARDAISIDEGTAQWVEDNAPSAVATIYGAGMILVVFGVFALMMIWFSLTNILIPNEEDSARMPRKLRVLRISASMISLILLYLWAVWCGALEYADIWIAVVAIAAVLAIYRFVPRLRGWLKSVMRRNRVKNMNKRIAYHQRRVTEVQERLARLEEHIKTHPA